MSTRSVSCVPFPFFDSYAAMPTPMREEVIPPVQLSIGEDGALSLTPHGAHPRLERAFSVSAARGMLDLLRYGAPPGASPLLHWLRQKAEDCMMSCLRLLRRGEDISEWEPPTAAELAKWLESMPPLAAGEVSVSLLRSWVEDLPNALAELARRECCSPWQWLSRLGEGWQLLGTVCFHLA